ncbi:ATP-grasp fold amidoligase family protein [uncultured Brachyspira sp.]|uniref:ATP-grasp fold amidoligase family protein n=1 Tax=uncultured Brachyspira sp. TaxID=221953 RepID=UPI00260CDA55|nr:ATP-grasp fold amidoligase family protein [uncultured Brachyspira sp.]
MTKKDNLNFKEKIIRKKFKESLGYELNLENPKTFNEKLQWLKLYYHDPLMTKCADKYLVREYVKEIIGEEYLIPLLGVWDSPDEIDFDSLPNQFVLKVNWGCGQNIIVKDKTKLNIDEIKEKLKYWLEPFSNFYYYNYEWQYKNIKPKIICEKYMKQVNDQLYDYKLFCFNGKVKYIQVDLDRFTNHTRCIYDTNWKKQEFKTHSFYGLYLGDIKKPKNLDLMIELSNKLSLKFCHVRVDFYEIDNKLYFGELTFTHGNGMELFSISEYDYKWGNLLDLPKEKKVEYDYINLNDTIEKLCDLEKTAIIYKKYEKNFILFKNKYERLKSKSFSLFGFFDEEEYFTLIIFGIKIAFKKTRPDQTRPDQTRPDLINYICIDYIFFYNNTKYQKLQPMLQYKIAA